MHASALSSCLDAVASPSLLLHMLPNATVSVHHKSASHKAPATPFSYHHSRQMPASQAKSVIKTPRCYTLLHYKHIPPLESQTLLALQVSGTRPTLALFVHF